MASLTSSAITNDWIWHFQPTVTTSSCRMGWFSSSFFTCTCMYDSWGWKPVCPTSVCRTRLERENCFLKVTLYGITIKAGRERNSRNVLTLFWTPYSCTHTCLASPFDCFPIAVWADSLRGVLAAAGFPWWRLIRCLMRKWEFVIWVGRDTNRWCFGWVFSCRCSFWF